MVLFNKDINFRSRWHLRLTAGIIILSFSYQSAVHAQSNSICELFDSKQLLFVECLDTKSFIESARKLAIVRHSRWNCIEEFLTHDEFGLIDGEHLERLRNAALDFVDEIQPSKFVFAINGDQRKAADRLAWQLVIQCDDDLDSNQTLDYINSCLEIMTLKGEPRFNLLLKSHTLKKSDIVIYESKQFGCFFQHEDLIVVASHIEEAMLIGNRISTVTKPYRKIVESRAFLSTKKQIQQTSKKSTSVDIHFSPILIPNLFEFLNVKQARLLGMHEISAVAIGINLVSTNESDDAQVVVNAYAKTTIPRSGISELVQLKNTPDDYPKLPDNVIFYMSANLDYQHFYFGFRNLLKNTFANESEQQARPDSEDTASYEENFANQIDSNIGICWYKRDGQILTSSFNKVFDAKKIVKLLLAQTEKLSKNAVGFGYESAEIEGEPALISKPNKYSKNRIGYIFLKNWMIQGDEEFLEDAVSSAFEEKSPSIVQNRLDCLAEHVECTSKPPIIIATWPEFWQVMSTTYFMKFYGRPMLKDFAKNLDGTEEENTRAITEFKKRLKGFNLGQPNSQEQCLLFIKLSVAQIAVEFVEDSVVAGWDNDGAGFRFAAMNFSGKSDE